MEFVAPVPPNIPKATTYASNKSTMSDYCRFAQTVLSLPPMKDLKWTLIWRLNKLTVARMMEQPMWFVLYASSALWC